MIDIQQNIQNDHLERIHWDRLGKVKIPESQIVVMEEGIQKPIPDTVKHALQEAVSDGISIFSLDDKLRPAFSSSRNELLMGIRIDQQDMFFDITHKFLDEDWLSSLRMNKGFSDFILSLGSDLTELDFYKAAEVYLLATAAHEMYHLRQFFKDLDYFVATIRDNYLAQSAKDEYQHYKLYWLSQGERSARAFTIRYLKEKIKEKGGKYSLDKDYIILFEKLVQVFIDKEKEHSTMAKSIREYEEQSRRDSLKTIIGMYNILQGDKRKWLIESCLERGFDIEAYIRSQNT